MYPLQIERDVISVRPGSRCGHQSNSLQSNLFQHVPVIPVRELLRSIMVTTTILSNSSSAHISYKNRVHHWSYKTINNIEIYRTLLIRTCSVPLLHLGLVTYWAIQPHRHCSNSTYQQSHSSPPRTP